MSTALLEQPIEAFRRVNFPNAPELIPLQLADLDPNFLRLTFTYSRVGR